jgi:sulfonate dioxygenase
LHSAVAQAEGARAAGLHVRRQEIETIHPVVRVHPVTGWKSVYVNPGNKVLSVIMSDPGLYLTPGFTRRIVGVPKAESDAILTFLFHQISENPDHQVRFKWEPNSIAIWDNRVRVYLQVKDFMNLHQHIGCDSLRHFRLLAGNPTCPPSYPTRGETDICCRL